MFSGIVQTTGIIEKAVPGRLVIAVPRLPAYVKAGSSVCVSGVCLTVRDRKAGRLLFDVMAETMAKTTLAKKKKGDKVNLEPSLRLGDEVGGHFVYGHVDLVGTVVGVTSHGGDRLLTIKPSRDFMRWIVPQGSVTIDGVSLTVAKQIKGTLTVSLVPYTVAHTTLGLLRKGDAVNLEADMLAKHVHHSTELQLGLMRL